MRKRFILLISGYLFFSGISLLSRWVYPLFGLVVVLGIIWPLAWAWRIGNWAEMGFSTQQIGKGLLWGIAAGIVSSLFGLMMLSERSLSGNTAQQLIIAAPFWLLVISPFQEFFFRGWLQSELADILGDWTALLLANLAFTGWHYFSPIVDLANFPLTSVAGFLATYAAGLAYALSYKRSRSVIAPWLGHSMSGLTFVAVGAMDFAQAMQ